MAKTMAHFSVWLIMALALVGRPAKAINCISTLQELLPCVPYLLSVAPRPSIQCCSGTQDVANLANLSKPNLRSTCECLKNAARAYPNINYGNARRLPALCNVKLNITIDPNIDCNRYTYVYFFITIFKFHFVSSFSYIYIYFGGTLSWIIGQFNCYLSLNFDDVQALNDHGDSWRDEEIIFSSFGGNISTQFLMQAWIYLSFVSVWNFDQIPITEKSLLISFFLAYYCSLSSMNIVVNCN